MGGDAAKLRVWIPTTAGVAEVLLLTEEDEAIGRSVACIGGTTDTADIAAGYHAFVARPTGVIEGLFGHSCYRLDVSAPIDAGTSWQLGVLAAHALHAAGRLAQENEAAQGVLWATGSVSHIPEKVAASRERLQQEAQAGRRALVALPAQNAALLSDEHRSRLAACGIEVLELDHVQPLWDRLAIELPEAPRKVAVRSAQHARAASYRGPAWAAVAALAAIALAGVYLLARAPSPVIDRQADAAPPSSKNEALVPEQVPFISDAEQAKIRSGYLSAPDHKALATNFNRAFFSSGQADDSSAAAAAMTGCQRLAVAAGGDGANCELYATGNRVVSKRGRPPLPPQPWFVHDPAIERPFVPAEVPLAPSPHTFDRYASRPNSKALAMSPTKVANTYFGDPSVEQVSRRVLEKCGHDAGVACMIIAVDDTFVVPVPMSAKAVEFFRPEALSGVPPQVAQDVARQLRGTTGGWSAVAVGAGGRVGTRLGAPSEQVAVEESLQACGKEDRDCRVAVIGPYLVERSR